MKPKSVDLHYFFPLKDPFSGLCNNMLFSGDLGKEPYLSGPLNC